MSGYLTPSSTFVNGAISAGMNDFGGVNIQAMWVRPNSAAGSGTIPTST